MFLVTKSLSNEPGYARTLNYTGRCPLTRCEGDSDGLFGDNAMQDAIDK